MTKVCIIEDDRGISASLKMYLENSDFEVGIHESGAGAVEYILEEKPDIVVLDINLPEIDGMQICQNLREESSVPVIMLTARSGETDKITGLEIGADDYLAKPFSPRELLARMNSVLRRSQLEETPEKQNTTVTYEDILLDTKKQDVCIKDVSIPLTKNEYDILEKIMCAQGDLVSRESLMKDVI